MAERKVTIPITDPVRAALIVSKAMPSRHLDVFIQLLLGAPDLPEEVER